MRRRRYGAVLTGLLVALLLTSLAAPIVYADSHTDDSGSESDRAYQIVQGTQVLSVEPLSGDESVEEFYDYRHPYVGSRDDPSWGRSFSSVGTTDYQRDDTSILMLYEGPQGVSLVAVHDALARTDYLVLACPLTDLTRHLIDAEALATLEPSAVVVNVARGGVVDTDALVAGLRTNGIRGAALDVTDPEPLPADLADPLFLSPDDGALDIAEAARDAYGQGEVDFFEKTRLSGSEVELSPSDADVADRDVVVVDDIVATGSTMSESIAVLGERGVGRVFVACVHPLLARDATTKLARAGVEAIYGTDTIERPVSAVSVAPAVADALDRV